MKKISILYLVFACLFGGQPQDRTITGTVWLGEKNRHHLADDALVKEVGGSGNRVSTNYNGEFSISVADACRALRISRMGYKDTLVSILGLENVEVVLRMDSSLIGVPVAVDTIVSFDPDAYEEGLQVVATDAFGNTVAPPPAPPRSEEEYISFEADFAAEAADLAAEPEPESAEKPKPTTWKRSGKTANTATLFIGDEEQLPLRGMQIAVTVDGFRARVLMDGFFYNDADAQLEGTFKMRLPQGATPYYFAFGESVYQDKDGKQLPFVEYEQIDFSPEGIENMRSSAWTNPREARIVEKEKAAFAYASETRQRVDPALAEWAGADVYNCRVFPLLPKQLHRIVIGYDMNLDQVGGDWLLNLDLPDGGAAKIVDVAIAEFKGVKSSVSTTAKTSIKKGYKRFRLTEPSDAALTIRYEGLRDMLLRSPQGEEGYFAAAITPELPATLKKSNPKDGVFALDISLSSRPDKFNIYLQLLEKMLNNNREDIPYFNVLLFNVEAFWWKTKKVPNTTQNVSDFMDFAQNLSLEGASDLSLAIHEISKGENNARIFLLSDGDITWGASDLYALSKNLSAGNPVFSYNTGLSGTSVPTLQHLARETGGAVFSVVSEDELEQASTAYRKPAWRIKEVRVDGAADVLLAGRPLYLYEGQKLLLSGRASEGFKGKAHLELQQADGTTKKITIPIKKSITSKLAKRVYGQMATEHLEEFESATHDYAVSYAKHFKVPGKTCSMLMLETEADYEEYNIISSEDQFVVKSNLVNDLLGKTLLAIEESLGDAKRAFLDWLGKLEGMPGMEFEKTAVLTTLCEKIDSEDYEVKPKGLKCKSHSKKDSPKGLDSLLMESRLDYDKLTATAQERLKKQGTDDALKLLSSLVENNPGDAVLARDVAFSALEWGKGEQAYFLLKRVLDSRPYEPQTYHAIAQALTQAGKTELALLYYEIAITTEWDTRFGEFYEIVELDYLNFLKNEGAAPDFKFKDYANEKRESLSKRLGNSKADLLVTITWNTDRTDIDLHVEQPDGEVCHYKNKTTKIGGEITQDVTTGYGPEMYVLKNAPTGKYQIKAHYYAGDTSRTSTRTKVYVTVYKHWGTPEESVSRSVVTLRELKKMHDVLQVNWE